MSTAPRLRKGRGASSGPRRSEHVLTRPQVLAWARVDRAHLPRQL